ncbi:MAG: YqhA family protein [Bifidobacteriaceae bacterium]|nr:YqhA family protein [Bifidobacteriaceae bacterium]
MALQHAEDDEDSSRLQKFRDFLESATESTIFATRWLLAPVFLGLCLALLGVVVNFVVQLAHQIPEFPGMTLDELATSILNLIDLALLGNLLLIVIFSGYENFVSKIDPAKDHEDRPAWMGTLDFSGLKIKILGSVVAISLIELLQDFIRASGHGEGEFKPELEIWRVALHLTFIVSGTLFAIMDYVAEKRVLVMAAFEKEHGDNPELLELVGIEPDQDVDDADDAHDAADAARAADDAAGADDAARAAAPGAGPGLGSGRGSGRGSGSESGQ